MHPPRSVPGGHPSRREVLRLLGLSGLAVAGGTGLAGCSAADRDALLSVDPGEVRLDEGVVRRPEPPGPSPRELRRRAVLAGSRAALVAYAAVGDGTAAPGAPVLAGRTGGTADRAAALDVHRVHAEVLVGSPAAVDAPVPLLTGPVPVEGGPALAAPDRPGAVLRTGSATAMEACLQELAEDDAQAPLAVLHARVAAARSAQAAGLAGDGASATTWPASAAGDGLLTALQDLLAQEQRARWSYAVVLAWSTDRSPDAEAARQDHTRRSEQLADLVRLLGAEPVGALPTYPTDDAGQPVDGPVSAAALALRLEDAVTGAAAAVLTAAVDDGARDWVRASVRVLAEAERARWSWGGAPQPWPGGTSAP